MIPINEPLTLLGGLTAAQFMREYWQRKPLLVRQAFPAFRPPLTINNIRELVTREEVESRLIWHDDEGWHMEQGPFDELPDPGQLNWTALAQSVDLHDDDTAQLMHQFRFIADARLDDVMISIASDGGGVGPHFDSYDVFLLQGVGRRRWRLSHQEDLSLVPGLPLKILNQFDAEEEHILEPGDMLYLPPHVAHDGIAIGDCMTLSIGFRAPTEATLASGMLEAAHDQIIARMGNASGLYADPPLPGPALDASYQDRGIEATTAPAALPEQLIQAAVEAAQKVEFGNALAARFLGVWLTEPSPNADFEPQLNVPPLSESWPPRNGLVLDRCTRMMYYGSELYINGELATVRARQVFQRLADTRRLTDTDKGLTELGEEDIAVLEQWVEDGWLHTL